MEIARKANVSYGAVGLSEIANVEKAEKMIMDYYFISPKIWLHMLRILYT